MQFGNSAGDFGGPAFRRPFGHDSAYGLSKLVALLLNSMQIVHNLVGKRCRYMTWYGAKRFRAYIVWRSLRQLFSFCTSPQSSTVCLRVIQCLRRMFVCFVVVVFTNCLPLFIIVLPGCIALVSLSDQKYIFWFSGISFLIIFIGHFLNTPNQECHEVCASDGRGMYVIYKSSRLCRTEWFASCVPGGMGGGGASGFRTYAMSAQDVRSRVRGPEEWTDVGSDCCDVWWCESGQWCGYYAIMHMPSGKW